MSLYTQQIDGCFSDIIGSHGIEKQAFQQTLEMVRQHIDAVIESADKGELPLLKIVDETSDLKELQQLSEEMRSQFDTMVVLGTGGSILNPESICALKRHLGDKELFFADTVDPLVFENRLSKIELKKTAFVAISKSGSTLETVSQALICLELCKETLGDTYHKHWFFITDPHETPLRNLAQEIGARIVDHPAKIGGRYSGLTSVGLLPAGFAGLDIAAVRKGASAIVKEMMAKKEQSMPAQSAAAYFCLLKKNISLAVMLPYVERLSDFTTWYSQIVAESLGKDGKGVTPIRAIGPLDQHSQLQLFLDGPQDKWITVITQSAHSAQHKIKQTFASMQQFAYLKNKTLADVLCAEQRGTIETLQNNKRPLRHIAIKNLDEENIGGLMMHMMLEVILLGKLMEINPFDQPAVEQGKVRTRELLSKQ